MLLTITIFLLWQELVIEWNLLQQCWVVSFQDHVNDLWDNLYWWFSGHMCIMCTLFTVVLDIFLPNRQCWCHPYVISSTLYISYYVQLSFCTLSAQMHIVHVIWMLSTDVHIICLSSLPLLIFLIIHNLVSAHCLHTCILLMSSVYCLKMHMLCICHLYCCYLYMYMSSTYYLGIYVLCAHYLKWSLISSFLTDNTNVIHTSSLVLFIYSIMENMSSATLPDDMSFTPLLDDMSSAPLPDDVSSAPLPDDMSSALQRNMSYLFEVWEASNRSTGQLVWFIWLFDWLA